MKRNLILMAALLLTTTMITSCGKDKPDTSKEGLYVGIIGFNNDLHSKTLKILNDNTKNEMKDFINDLTMEDGTVLYHAVSTALDKIEALTPPSDLINVSIVTFTDGLDQGSYYLNDNFSSGDAYLSNVNQRIQYTKIGDNQVPISAYSVGVRAENINEAVFRTSLEKLSSNPHDNVFLVDNMTQVGQIFSDIAQDLYHQSSSWDVKLKTSGPEDNSLYRFTFDNLDANESQCYIEGIFRNNATDGCVFKDVTYVGLTDCGSVIYPTVDGIFVYFTFSNLFTLDGEQVTTLNTKQWVYDDSSSSWRVVSEFNSSGNVETTEEFKSAIIMLVLDCSSSLGNDFANVKNAACQFIETLNGNTHQRK